MRKAPGESAAPRSVDPLAQLRFIGLRHILARAPSGAEGSRHQEAPARPPSGLQKKTNSFCVLTSGFHSVPEINGRHFSASAAPTARVSLRSPPPPPPPPRIRKHPRSRGQTDGLGKQRPRRISSLPRCVREAKAGKLAGKTARGANPAGRRRLLALSRFLIPVPSTKREGRGGLERGGGGGHERWQPQQPGWVSHVHAALPPLCVQTRSESIIAQRYAVKRQRQAEDTVVIKVARSCFVFFFPSLLRSSCWPSPSRKWQTRRTAGPRPCEQNHSYRLLAVFFLSFFFSLHWHRRF